MSNSVVNSYKKSILTSHIGNIQLLLHICDNTLYDKKYIFKSFGLYFL